MGLALNIVSAGSVVKVPSSSIGDIVGPGLGDLLENGNHFPVFNINPMDEEHSLATVRGVQSPDRALA